MIECPQCWSAFQGNRCSCGYVIRNKFQPEAKKDDPFFTELAKNWNDSMGCRHLTGDDRKKKLAELRKRFTGTRIIDSEPRLWAAKILSRIADGEILPELVERYAKLSFDCGGSDE